MEVEKYSFSKSPPADVMKNDVAFLTKTDDQQFNGMVQLCVECIVEAKKNTNIQEAASQFAAEQGLNSSSVKSAVTTLLTVLNGALKRNLTAAQVKEDLLKLGLDEGKGSIMEQKWQQYGNVLSRSALSQTLTVNQLVDMDWKFGVTAASSELNKVASTFLQLKLVINKGNKRENVFMELTLPQFYSFLHEMEKAKASLEHYS